jgi:hypothetical protein
MEETLHSTEPVETVSYIVTEDYESMGRALDNLGFDVIEITLVGKGILQGEECLMY